MLCDVSKYIISQTDEKKYHADWQKYPKRRKQGGNPRNYKEETDTILEEFNLAFPFSCHGLNRHIFDAQSAPEICHSDGGGIGECIRK